MPVTWKTNRNWNSGWAETKDGWELNIIYSPGTDPALDGKYNYKGHNQVNWKNQGMEVGFDKKYCISVQFPEVDSYTEDILVFRKHTVKRQGVKRHAVWKLL